MNRKFFTAFRKAYPLVYRPVWKENLLLSFVDIFHGLSFAAVVILTQRFFDSVAGGVQGTVPGREAAAAAAGSGWTVGAGFSDRSADDPFPGF